MLPPNFMFGSLQNTLSGTPAIALIPYLYNGSSRAASSFSMPGSEAIFHGFVCTRFHLPELSLPASFMYSSLHCLYEVEANIHPKQICVKSFLFKMARKVWGLGSGSKDPMEPAGREGRICFPMAAEGCFLRSAALYSYAVPLPAGAFARCIQHQLSLTA